MTTATVPLHHADFLAADDDPQPPSMIRAGGAQVIDLLRAARSATVPADRRASDEVLARLGVGHRSDVGPVAELHLPIELLGDLLTVAEHTAVPLPEVRVCHVGDATTQRARSWLVVGALLGMDIRIAAPMSMWPTDQEIEHAEDLAALSGARLLITSDAGHAVLGADIVVAGDWGTCSVLPIDQAAPPAFTVSEPFVESSGVSSTVTLSAHPQRRAAGSASNGVAENQLRNRRVVADVLVDGFPVQRAMSGPIVPSTRT